MPFSYHAIEIPIEEIDRSSESFLFSPRDAEEMERSLSDSISRVGVLSPPFLMPRQGRSYQIVTGWHRIAAHHARFGNKPLFCLVLGPGTKDTDCLVLAFEEILRKRQPSPIEIAVFFSKTAKQQGGFQIIERYLPILRLPANRKSIDRYLSLLQLEEPVLMAAHRGAVSQQLAFELASLSMRDRLSLFEVVDQLHLSVSNQKKLSIAVAELAGRRKTSYMDVLAHPEALEILNHPSANVPQKTAKLMAWLEKERSPLLHQAENEFRLFVKRLQLPDFMRLEHSLSFEKDSLALSIIFANGDQLEQALPQLKKIITQSEPELSP